MNGINSRGCRSRRRRREAAIVNFTSTRTRRCFHRESNPPYPPITSATFSEAQRMHKAIGFDRGVIVHSAIYGSDHRLLLHALESLNDRDHYRGHRHRRRPGFGQRT